MDFKNITVGEITVLLGIIAAVYAFYKMIKDVRKPREERDIDVIIISMVVPSTRHRMTVQSASPKHKCLVLLHIRCRHVQQARCTIRKLSLYRPPQKHETSNKN